MKEEAKKLAKEFKSFLSNSEEDDFITGGAGVQKTPAVSSAPAPARTPPEEPVAVTGLEEIAAQVVKCKKCPLGATRIKAVPGEGNPKARLMFIGEGPGFDEDHQGRPFIGRAGQLLTKMIAAMGLQREEVFIGNMVKCHPMIDSSDPEKHGNDRAPSPEEIANCRKFIEAQIAAIQPEFIVALGGVAAKSLIRGAASLGALRGKTHVLELDNFDLGGKTKIIATYHPAALLRNPNWKKEAWDDLKMLMKEMGLPVPAKQD